MKGWCCGLRSTGCGRLQVHSRQNRPPLGSYSDEYERIDRIRMDGESVSGSEQRRDLAIGFPLPLPPGNHVGKREQLRLVWNPGHDAYASTVLSEANAGSRLAVVDRVGLASASFIDVA